MVLKLEMNGDGDGFHCPAGIFKGKLLKATPYPKKQGGMEVPGIRFVFEVRSEGDPRTYKVGKTFAQDISKNSDLYCFLKRWLGNDYLVERDGRVDTDKLAGMEADIETQHVPNPNHSFPWVEIKAFPLGSKHKSIFKQRGDGI
jgi:hypothetical protein